MIFAHIPYTHKIHDHLILATPNLRELDSTIRTNHEAISDARRLFKLMFGKLFMKKKAFKYDVGISKSTGDLGVLWNPIDNYEQSPGLVPPKFWLLVCRNSEKIRFVTYFFLKIHLLVVLMTCCQKERFLWKMQLIMDANVNTSKTDIDYQTKSNRQALLELKHSDPDTLIRARQNTKPVHIIQLNPWVPLHTVKHLGSPRISGQHSAMSTLNADHEILRTFFWQTDLGVFLRN